MTSCVNLLSLEEQLIQLELQVAQQARQIAELEARLEANVRKLSDRVSALEWIDDLR